MTRNTKLLAVAFVGLGVALGGTKTTQMLLVRVEQPKNRNGG